MNSRGYSSYAEIERDLEILNLEREIHFRKMVAGIQQTRKNLSPLSLLGGYLGSDYPPGPETYGKIFRVAAPLLMRWLKKLRKRSDCENED